MLKLTRKASADLDDIFEHYKERLGAEQAQAIVHDVVAESRALERSPVAWGSPWHRRLASWRSSAGPF